MLLALTPESTGAPASAAPALTRPRSIPPERLLMDAIRCGDERLAPQVYASLLPAVHTTLSRVLGTSGRAQEQLTGRCIERIITEISSHPSPWVCKLEAWATAVSARVALDVLRSRTRSRAVEVSWGDTMAQLSGDEQRATNPGSASDRLRWLLAELPEQQAQAVLMCDVMALVPTEVAVILGVGLEHVRRLLSAGHERLSRALA
jgi:DNA-directed RNA polymerase specialized sigma24 family protein